jgi:hypothetical protein
VEGKIKQRILYLGWNMPKKFMQMTTQNAIKRMMIKKMMQPKASQRLPNTYKKKLRNAMQSAQCNQSG